MKRVLILLCFLTACVNRPGTPETFHTEKVFVTPEGCSVSRFVDGGRYHFIAACGCKTAEENKL